MIHFLPTVKAMISPPPPLQRLLEPCKKGRPQSLCSADKGLCHSAAQTYTTALFSGHSPQSFSSAFPRPGKRGAATSAPPAAVSGQSCADVRRCGCPGRSTPPPGQCPASWRGGHGGSWPKSRQKGLVLSLPSLLLEMNPSFGRLYIRAFQDVRHLY